MLLLLMLLPHGPALVQGVSGIATPAIDARAGGVVVREAEPGVAFATLRVGKNKPTLPFVVLLRHTLGGAGTSDSCEEVRLDDRILTLRHTLTLDGKMLVILLTVELAPDGSKLVKETLTLNGKAVDLAKGRILLVDLTGEMIRWEAKKLTLPTSMGTLTEAWAASDFGRVLLTDLAKQDAAVRAFVDGK